MAGSVVITQPKPESRFQKIVMVWTSAAGGAADGTTSSGFDGAIDRIIVDHGTGGTAADTGYSVVLNDEDGYDLLDGGGASIVTANGTLQFQGNKGLSGIANSTITIGVTSAGNANSGTVTIYVR